MTMNKLSSPQIPSMVAAVQMVSGDCLQSNLIQAAELIGEAAAAGAQLIVLPENFALFGGGQQLQQGQLENSTDGPIRQFLSQQARHHHIWLVGGTLPTTAADASDRLPAEGKVYPSTFVVDAEGHEVGRYDKLHLFDVDVEDQQGSYRESDYFEAGQSALIIDTPVGRMGVAICYDLRFPELFRWLWSQGAELFVIPSAFTYRTGEAHWRPLLQSRAIENIAYVIAANQGGKHTASRETYGHSQIIDPWGDVLTCQEQGPGVITAVIDRERLVTLRQQMPVLQHRRFNMPTLV